VPLIGESSVPALLFAPAASLPLRARGSTVASPWRLALGANGGVVTDPFARAFSVVGD
jgi:hypothetical protein